VLWGELRSHVAGLAAVDSGYQSVTVTVPDRHKAPSHMLSVVPSTRTVAEPVVCEWCERSQVLHKLLVAGAELLAVVLATIVWMLRSDNRDVWWVLCGNQVVKRHSCGAVPNPVMYLTYCHWVMIWGARKGCF